MAIAKAAKEAYNIEVKDYKKAVDEKNSKIKEATKKRNKMSNIKGYFNLEIAKLQLDIIDDYFKMSDLSLEMLGIKNETFLNNARKEIYKVLQAAEEIVGKDVDRSLKENDEFLQTIDRVTPKHILHFIDRIHNAYHNLKAKFGEGSKWKWSFVELFSRISIITKNITSFADIQKFRDPRSDFFYERRDLMNLCKDSLTEAAKQYRTKYEMAGKAREDLKRSIELLGVLRKIHVIFGEDGEATKLKNTIDAAKATLEATDKSKDNKKKK